jgi:hypothetical protein
MYQLQLELFYMNLEVNDVLKIGRVVNTHGIKGEVRVISDFKYKDDVFKEGSILYIDGKKYIIKSYRKHKNFDLINYQKRIVSLFASNVSYTSLSKLRKNLQIIRKGTRRDDISSIVEKTLAQKKLEVIRENIERICSNKRKNFL